MQQTPASSLKVSIKVFIQRPGAPAPDTYVFSFTSPKAARDEQVAITDELRIAIELVKKQNEEVVVRAGAPDKDGDSGSAAMAFAKTVSAAAQKDEDAMLADAQLITNVALQQSLLKSNATLRQRFNESLKEKPESITMSQFSAQFWSTRAHLLRAHAVEKAQSQGAHNVLSEIKPKNENGQTKLDISKEQIQIVFKQHPIIRRVYNETVPAKFSEAKFWADFFQSRLLKAIKGERIKPDQDALNPVLDKYINFDEDAERAKQIEMLQVPHFINLEGNEQHHSQRQGNRADWTMRPNAHDKVPILRALNNMSETMMAKVQPSDAASAGPHAPVGMDEETFNQLRLRDLQQASDDSRILLHVKDQSQFLSADKSTTSGVSAEAALYSKQSPAKVLAKLQQDLKSNFVATDGTFGVNLESAIGVRDDSSSDSDSDSEKRGAKRLKIGGKAARAAATSHVMRLIRTRRAQMSASDLSFDAPSGTFPALDAKSVATETGLSESVVSSLIMTHNTAVEFLHYFFSVFYSGDPDRAGELATLAQTLENSITRVDAVGDAAERERGEEIDRLKRKAKEIEKRTGKKQTLRVDRVKGGRAEVMRVAEPTLRAVKEAAKRYSVELERQRAAVSLAQNV